jgi:hypothetical protein
MEGFNFVVLGSLYDVAEDSWRLSCVIQEVVPDIEKVASAFTFMVKESKQRKHGY